MKKITHLLLIVPVTLASLAFAQSVTFGTKDLPAGPPCATKFISSSGGSDAAVLLADLQKALEAKAIPAKFRENKRFRSRL